MKKIFLLWSLLLSLSQSVYPQLTIHILNPWRDDTCDGRVNRLRMQGEMSYYPGNSMTPEGNGWFKYTYRPSLNWFLLTSECGPQTQDGRIIYPDTFYLTSLTASFPLGTKEIWISPTEPRKPPLVYDQPPHGKIINILNPWPDNSSRIIFGNKKPAKMRPVTGLCGWYWAYFLGPLDSLRNVTFTDYYYTKKYTAKGMIDGPGIDLRSVLGAGDTVYIMPAPFPDGAPSLSASFPGRIGDCGIRKISGHFRDWAIDTFLPNNQRSFWIGATGYGTGHFGMLQNTLTGPDYKPKITTDPTVSLLNLGHLETWYVTDTFPDGTTNDTCIELTIKKGEDGRWEYDSDVTGGFFPLDSFHDPNNIQYSNNQNPPKYHNYHFTMEMHLEFVYHKGSNQEFDFTGDDDLWIFINNRLAIDLGGLNNSVSDTIFLDRPKRDLGLQDGMTYKMDIFYAERNPIGSNFKIKTSIDLYYTASVYFKDTVIGPGRTKYDIWQRRSTVQSVCGENLLLEEELAKVDFFLEGPQFTVRQPLPAGVHYGGIIVDPNKYRITLDSAAITGLISGEYRITFVSTVDANRSGYLTFTIPRLPPDHFDIITDKTILDMTRDVRIDSLVIDLNDSAAQIYAVIRDKKGGYLRAASNPVWTSSDTGAATATQSPTDKSRCIIIKNATGVTWITVSDPEGKLRSDSVKVITRLFRPFPLIKSAAMLDGNADLVPDTLRIRLSRTFKSDQHLDSVLVIYKGQRYSFPDSLFVVRDSIVFVPFTSLQDVDCKPSGSVIIAMKTRDGPRSDTNTFTDGVSPALIAASVLENDDTQPDILFLTFSEPVKDAMLIGKQLLLIRMNAADTATLTITQTISKTNDSTFAVKISGADPKAHVGDRLRLVPWSMGGQIADQSDNKPHLLNRSVVLEFRPGAALIASAWYLDVDADGRIDRVAVRFKRKVDLSEIDSIAVQWKMQYYSAQPKNALFIDDSTISFSLSTVREISTGGGMEIFVTYRATPNFARSSLAADGAAPVIVEAELFPGALTSETDRLKDSLRVKFSETVSDPGVRPFLLSTRDSGVIYQFRLSLLGAPHEQCRFVIESIEPDGRVFFAKQGDTVWIDTAAHVRDIGGNPQGNPQNRRVPLKVTWQNPKWRLTISSNPFHPLQTPIPAEYRDGGGANGTVIILRPTTPIDADRMRGTIAIYDALGNAVGNSSLRWAKGKFYYAWTGTNLLNRIVGTGAYLGVVNIFDGNQQIYDNTITIGVKR